MKKDIINICFVATDNYAKFIPVVIQSIWENTKSLVHYYVIGDIISNDNKNKITRYVNSVSNSEISFVDFDITELDGVATGWFPTPMPYARIFAADLLPIDKVIYLDLDIIINGNIKEIYDADLQGKSLGAMLDTVDWAEHKQKLGIAPDHNYFNSGFLLIDCQQWRQNNFSSRLLKLIKDRSPEFRFADQDALNIFFSPSETTILDGSFNRQPTFTEDSISVYNGIHYTLHKPSTKINNKYGEYFWQYARKTPYYEELFCELIKLCVLRKKKISKLKKLKYKILSYITFGKTRKKYKEKYKNAKGK